VYKYTKELQKHNGRIKAIFFVHLSYAHWWITRKIFPLPTLPHPRHFIFHKLFFVIRRVFGDGQYQLSAISTKFAGGFVNMWIKKVDNMRH
jgi:hypothetical protein